MPLSSTRRRGRRLEQGVFEVHLANELTSQMGQSRLTTGLDVYKYFETTSGVEILLDKIELRIPPMDINFAIHPSNLRALRVLCG